MMYVIRHLSSTLVTEKYTTITQSTLDAGQGRFGRYTVAVGLAVMLGQMGHSMEPLLPYEYFRWKTT